MGVIYPQASFKNSRVAARKPTTQADTYDISVPNGSNTLIAAAQANRTYVTIRNENSTAGNDIRYDYFDNPAMLTEGFLLKAGEAADLESPEAIYAQAVGATVAMCIDQGTG